MNTDEHGLLFGMLAVHLNDAELHVLQDVLAAFLEGQVVQLLLRAQPNLAFAPIWHGIDQGQAEQGSCSLDQHVR